MHVPSKATRLSTAAGSADLRKRILKCLVSACFSLCAKRLPKMRDNSKRGGFSRREYKSVVTGQKVSIHPSSTMFGKSPVAVIYGELVSTKRQYMRCVTEIDPAWLPELAPQCFRSTKLKNTEEKLNNDTTTFLNGAKRTVLEKNNVCRKHQKRKPKLMLSSGEQRLAKQQRQEKKKRKTKKHF